MRPNTRQVLRSSATCATVLATLATAAGLIACAGGGDAAANQKNAASGAPVNGQISASPPGNPADTDMAARGKGLPTGYVAQFDKASGGPGDASYTQRETGRWEVHTGGAHILYSPHDSVRGKYTASATFEQLEAPAHPEGFGVFVGGSNLDQPASQRYSYFLVRGDGKYLVKVRDGAGTHTITNWTENAAIPKQDGTGKGLYGIKVDVDGKSARVSVNGAPVTTITTSQGPLDGITGVRINHNLHVVVTPVTVVR